MSRSAAPRRPVGSIPLAALALLIGTAAQAQPASRPAPPSVAEGRLGRAELTESTAQTYYRYYVPGEATIQVSVVGSVPQPGLYEVGLGTDLGRVLALAGGPRYDPRERNRRRRVELRLYRPNAGPEPIYATTLQDAATNPGVYPQLREGDTLLVDVIEVRGFEWQDAAAIAGGLSAVALILQVLTN